MGLVKVQNFQLEAIVVVVIVLGVFLYFRFLNRDNFKPKDYYLYPQRGFEKAQAGDLDGAEHAYNETIRENPKFLPAYLQRAALYHHQGDYDAAIADYDFLIAACTEVNKDFSLSAQVASLGPSHREMLYTNRGTAKLQKSDYEGAIADFTEAIRLNQAQPLAFYNRGLAYLWMDDYGAAIRDFTEAIDLVPTEPIFYVNRANARRRNDDLEQALADCEYAIELDPNQKTDVYVERAWIRYFKEDIDGAMADCNTALRLLPQSAAAYYTRGAVRIKQKDWDGGIDDLTQSIELEHTYLYLAYARRAYAHDRKGNIDAALADNSMAIQLKPDFAIAYNNRVSQYTESGELEKALADCDKAISLDPESVYSFGSRGYTYFLMGRYEDALADFQKAIDLKADHSYALAGHGITLSALGRTEEAILVWKSLVEIDSNYRSVTPLIEEHRCTGIYLDEARKLIAKL